MSENDPYAPLKVEARKIIDSVWQAPPEDLCPDCHYLWKRWRLAKIGYTFGPLMDNRTPLWQQERNHAEKIKEQQESIEEHCRNSHRPTR